MGEFFVNENGCRVLSEQMYKCMVEIHKRIEEIDQRNGSLKEALGDDYGAIARSVMTMKGEIANGYKELRTVIIDMSEYLSRVKKVRVALGENK
ncbi:MAG: hypothetical protein J5643_05050 [Lachnospiraceae bacterium]|nr:hypothetical protein [Lachnospiraceae bacterium]